jgi:hypothetical protein
MGEAQGTVTGFAPPAWGCSKSAAASCRTTRCRCSTGSAPTNTSWTSRDVVDFISAADTPFLYELNIWYPHAQLRVRTPISGETDFPCMSDDRVGAGRSCVHLPKPHL